MSVTVSSSGSTSMLPSVERKGILVLHRSGVPIINRNPPTDSTTTANSTHNSNSKGNSKGNKKQPPIYIFLSGFPDKSSTFDSFANAFESSHHVVKMSYPDMDEEFLRSFWGYSLRQVEMALVAVIQEYRNTYQCHTLYLHGFDWGAAVTLITAHHYPHLITKLIQQDIGIMNATDLSIYNLVVIPAYQIFLAIVFILSRFLFWGNDRLAARLLGFLPRCFPWFLLMTDAPSDIFSQMLPHRCYPYLRVLVDMLTGHAPYLTFSPTVPQFFAFGAKKNVAFHSQRYLDMLQSTPKCQWKAYKSGSHWFHTSHKREFQQDILQFLKE